ncbi:hypothetical protein AALP_AA1G012200 [Arabis alpina]|uniref:K-box domain-containing protein n=1 Tax=Arabis alpina TaxID=50452 RepID=A0A087HKB6_ARAAL|nr:hypothetical protein AALP_AA1G012200 [Arabis alpina]
MARENGDETARVPCNFCEFSRYERVPQEQGYGIVSMESEIRRLRVLTRRITGKDLDGVSFPELELLEGRVKHVFEIVKEQKTQVEQEEREMLRERLQMKQAANEVPFSASGISPGETPQNQDDEAPKPVTAHQRAYERRLAEPMESEFERLWLLNERMNGRKLEGMTLFELSILKGQLLGSMHRISDMKTEPIAEDKARRLKEEQERCSLDSVKVEDHHRGVGQSDTRFFLSQEKTENGRAG